MKKSQIRTLALLAAAALLLGAALAVLRYEKEPEVLPTLVEIPQVEIDQLCFLYRDQSVTLQLRDGSWQVLLSNTDLALPAQQDMVSTMLTALCQIRPQQELESPDPALFAAATLQASVDLLSGSDTQQVQASQQIRVYSMNAITDQLYVQVDDRYYLTDTALMDILSVSQLELLEQYPIPKPDDHRRVTVENAQDTVTLSCVGAETGGDDGVWYAQTADGWVETDQDHAYNFYFLTWDMHWKSTVAVLTGETDLAAFGLENPQAIYTLHYGEETFRLYLGNDLPDGTTYAMCDGSSLVYTMDSLLAQWLAQATTATLFNS